MTTTKVQAEHIDYQFGFPVRVEHVPMRRMLGEWVLDVDATQFEQAVLLGLAIHPDPLTGDQVRFIRLWMELTLTGFAMEMGVTHPAVYQWEGKREEPTGMRRNMEFFLRYLLLEQLVDRGQVRLVIGGTRQKPMTLAGLRQILSSNRREAPDTHISLSDLRRV